MKNVLRALPALALVLSCAWAAPAAAAKPRLYLSWHAPYGAPRASDTLWVRPSDGGKDTLYLTFVSGQSWPKFYGLLGTLLFHTAVGDSLEQQWLDERNLQTDFMTDSIPYGRRMWRGTGSTRFSFYDFFRASGRLKFSSVRHPASPVAIQDSVPYLFARVMVAHPSADIRRWNQPICVEWTDAEFLPDSTGVVTVHSGPEGRPFVSMNSATSICDPFRPSIAQPPAAGDGKKTSSSKGKKAKPRGK
jgi:hypothetical protein